MWSSAQVAVDSFVWAVPPSRGKDNNYLCFHPVYGYSGLDCSNQYTLYPICQGGGYIPSNK